MIFERDYDTDKPRQTVWCRSTDLVEDTTTGTYTFVAMEQGVTLGDHSIIFVTDTPGLVLSWDAANEVARVMMSS